MNYLSYSLLTSSAVLGILAAWLFYRLKVTEARHHGVVRELEEVTKRRAELAAQVISLTGQMGRLQREAVYQYEAIAKSIEESLTPGTPGSVDGAISKLREAFKASVHRHATDPVLPAAPAKPKG